MFGVCVFWLGPPYHNSVCVGQLFHTLALALYFSFILSEQIFFLFSSPSLLEKEMLILKVWIWDPEIEFCSIAFTVWVLSESGDIVVQWLDHLKQLTVCCQHRQVKSHFHLWKYICYHHFAAFLAFPSYFSTHLHSDSCHLGENNLYHHHLLYLLKFLQQGVMIWAKQTEIN